MVHKIKILIFCILLISMTVFALKLNGHTETNLVKTLLPQNVIKSTNIVPIADKSASLIKVVFEADEEKNLEPLKENFIKEVDKDYFEINKPDITGIMDKYLTQPTNFLSYETRELLKNKKYDDIYSKSMASLFNPSGIQFSTLDRDPYLLFDDFLLANKKNYNDVNNIDDKYYDFISLKIKNEEGLSPDLSNKKIKEIINIQKNLSNDKTKIYLAGSPIHSYHTSKRAIFDINLICILSTLIIIFLTYRYLKNLKLLLPIALSIIFGMLDGYISTKLWFKDFQVITMVFSTTLIGIGIDYSYHYFFADKTEKDFIKNLSFSLLTTIVPFALLYLTGIELLKQVAIFTIFGLFAIYFTVLFVYPCFNFKSETKCLKPHPILYRVLITILGIFCIIGLFKLHFNDSLMSMYSPSKELQNAETLYSKVSGGDIQSTQILTVYGENLENILQKEEEVTDKLSAQNIDYVSISKFIPSEKRQKENFELVKDLYNNNLNNYSDVLTGNQISDLKNKTFKKVDFDLEKNPYLSDFLINNKTSIIIVFNDKTLNLSSKDVKEVNIKSDIEKYMKHYRIILMLLFPVVILVLAGILLAIYKNKKGLLLILPSVAGVIGATGLTCLINGEINLFSIIALFMILGFTMDYSIFRANAEEKTESAILVSCLTTTFSFLLLSFSGFKLLSSISLVLFFGILISYLTGYILFEKQK